MKIQLLSDSLKEKRRQELTEELRLHRDQLQEFENNKGRRLVEIENTKEVVKSSFLERCVDEKTQSAVAALEREYERKRGEEIARHNREIREIEREKQDNLEDQISSVRQQCHRALDVDSGVRDSLLRVNDEKKLMLDVIEKKKEKIVELEEELERL